MTIRHIRSTPAPIVGAGWLVAAVSLLPLIVIVIATISVGWATAVQLLFRPRVGELLRNTLALIGAATALCLLLGIGAAWLTQRTDLPRRSLWHVLLVAPLAIPAFVNSYAWISLTSRVEGYAGAVLIVTLSYFPLVYLPVAAALGGLDPALEESAASLGLGRWRTFWRVVVPQLRPAWLGGALLVGLHLLAEFGALQMLRYPTFTTAIYDQFTSTFNGPAANMLAAVLVALCLGLLLIDLRWRGQVRYARVGSGASRQVKPLRLGRWTPLVALPLVVLLVLALGVPFWSLGRWMIEGRSTSLKLDQLVEAALGTLQLGFVGALCVSVCALPVAWLSVRARGTTSTLLERSTFIGHSLPGIVVALALVSVAIRFARPLYQTAPLLLVAYTILFVPLAIVSVRAGLLQAPRALEEAAHALGASHASAFARVTLRLILPHVGAGAALVFLAIATELTATLLLSPIGTQTLATRFWANADEIAYGAAAPYAVLMVLLSMPATYVLTHTQARASAT